MRGQVVSHDCNLSDWLAKSPWDDRKNSVEAKVKKGDGVFSAWTKSHDAVLIKLYVLSVKALDLCSPVSAGCTR